MGVLCLPPVPAVIGPRKQLKLLKFYAHQVGGTVLIAHGPPSAQISSVKSMSSELRKIQSSNRTYAYAYPGAVCSSRSIGKSIGFQRQQEFFARNTQHAIL